MAIWAWSEGRDSGRERMALLETNVVCSVFDFDMFYSVFIARKNKVDSACEYNNTEFIKYIVKRMKIF